MSRGVERADLLPAAVITVGVGLAFVPHAMWFLPLSFVLRSIAPVHQHCHAHYSVFRNRVLDELYDFILMLAAGNTTAVWELQHVRGHHQEYLGRTHDPANNDRFGKSRLVFTILGDAMSFVDSWRIGKARMRLVRQQVMQIGVLVALFVWNPTIAIAFFVVPWVLLRWAVFWFSYAQHDTVPMTDVYSGSVTHFGWTNRLYLNVGHHTAHHEKPTLHWTRLPARTAQIVERIPAACLR